MPEDHGDPQHPIDPATGLPADSVVADAGAERADPDLSVEGTDSGEEGESDGEGHL